jgi:serine/threonine-protein kinase
MGSDPGLDKKADKNEQPQHTLYLPDYYIAKTPVTQAQYAAFIQAAGYRAPSNWSGKTPLKGKENHPVVYVSWHDAVAYCKWLSEATDQLYRLPTEAEWEKAARGTDGRIYPWGNRWDKNRCNAERGEKGTTAVDAYPNGASPNGCLDMAGNVSEWTLNLWGEGWDRPEFGYPYDPNDGRENVEAGAHIYRVWRGGAWDDVRNLSRCTSRYGNPPDLGHDGRGYRVVVSSMSPRSGR